MQLHGGGKSERSFIHINDVCRATMQIMLNAKIGETYHISTKHTITIRGLVENICSLLNKNFDDYVEISEDRIGKDNAYKLDSSKLRNEFNWTEKIDLKEGLEDCLEWFNANLSLISQQKKDYSHKE